MKETLNSAEWTVRALKKIGVSCIFVLCGNGMHTFFEACRAGGLRVIGCHNEQAAAYMADTWARLTRTLGVVAVSSGPGHLNALVGVANSMWDGSPLLFLSGASEESTRGQGHFQELDQVGTVESICKYADRVTESGQLPFKFRRAVSTAVTGRPGPVHLTIPADIFASEVDPRIMAAIDAFDAGWGRVLPRGREDGESVEQAAEMIRQSRRPLLLAGNGLYYSRGEEVLSEFAAQTDIPVITPIWERGTVERPIPQYVGVAEPWREASPSFRFLAESDLVLSFGMRLDYRVDYLSFLTEGEARLIQVSESPEEAGRTHLPDLTLIGNCREIMGQIADHLPESPAPAHTEWLERIAGHRREVLKQWESPEAKAGGKVTSARLCHELAPLVRDEETLFLVDGGNIGRWIHLLLFDRHPARWLTCGTSGVVGYGIPGAIAAGIAESDRRVLLVSGDGSAGFGIMEVATAVRHGIDLTAVIAADGAWGIVRDQHAVATEFGTIRYDRMAEALGGRGMMITDPGKLREAVGESMEQGGVNVILVPVEQGGIHVISEKRCRAKSGGSSE